MDIGTVGYNHSHDKDFYFERPNGIGCWLFLHIRTPAFFRLGDNEYKVKKESTIIISPSMPCMYRADGCEYADDWIFFGLTDEEKERLLSMGVVFDKPVYLGKSRDLSSTIHKVIFEHYSSERLHGEMEIKYFEILLLMLARIFNSDRIEGAENSSEKNSAMVGLRASIYSDPAAHSSVSNIADAMHMSCSGLQHLYKRLFGVSISFDIIKSRIAKAKDLLMTTNLTVDKVAERCGYSCTYSFLRQFKEKCGCTPTQFRRKAIPDGEQWLRIHAADE